MKILLVTSNLPYPLITGGKIRVWQLLRQISQEHEVILVSLLDSAEEVNYLPFLRPYCSRIETVVKRRRRSRIKLFSRILKTIFRGQPPRNAVAYYPEMASKLREVVQEEKFDAIQIEQSYMASYIEFLPKPTQYKKIISLYDIGAVQSERIFRIQTDLRNRVLTGLDWFFLRNWEPRYLSRHFDKCLVVSSVDQAILKKRAPDLDISVIPNGVDITQYDLLPMATSQKLIFIGKMNYAPNIDAVHFFCREIFPSVKEEIRDVELMIVGGAPVDSVESFSSNDITVTGFVESVVPYYQQSEVCIVPLRAGSGTRLKILEAMALGRPVISTGLGCEGLGLTHGENIMIADTPADFAESVVRVMSDRELWKRLVQNGRRHVEAHYDWRVIGDNLLRVYNELTSAKVKVAKR
jgi:sugar transferase (PEP-CTERM/EpsH1 system associated)